MYLRITMMAVLFSLICLQDVRAGQCSEHLTRAMQDEGLSRDRIDAICARADQYARKNDTVFTPDRILHDLEGRSIGPEAVVKVKPGAGSGSPAGGTSVYVPVPMGIVLDRTSITDLKVLQVKKVKGRATVVASVETVSSHAGKLRLEYEYIADEWILREIENLSFRRQ